MGEQPLLVLPDEDFRAAHHHGRPVPNSLVRLVGRIGHVALHHDLQVLRRTDPNPEGWEDGLADLEERLLVDRHESLLGKMSVLAVGGGVDMLEGALDVELVDLGGGTPDDGGYLLAGGLVARAFGRWARQDGKVCEGKKRKSEAECFIHMAWMVKVDDVCGLRGKAKSSACNIQQIDWGVVGQGPALVDSTSKSGTRKVR